MPPQVGITGTTNLLVATSGTIQDIAKVLRAHTKNAEYMVFFADLMAYCVMIREHVNRTKTAGITIDHKDLHGILIHFDSITTAPFLQEHPTYGMTPFSNLRTLNHYWEGVWDGEDVIKLQFINQSVSFGISAEERNGFIQVLVLWEENLRARYPDNSSRWVADDFAPQKEPPYAVWGAAKSAFTALAACKNCPCSPMHDFEARLSLGTYRKSALEDDTGEKADFDIYLSFMEQDWHESRVHATKEKIAHSVADTGPVIQSNKRAQAKAMKVKQLCAVIQKIRPMATPRLEFKVTRGQLYKLQSERSQFFIDKTRDATSLEEYIRMGPRSFTERTRRILAVFLSYAALHLNNTPWLKPTWGSSDIIFFYTNTSTVPLRPFIQTRLCHSGSESPDAKSNISQSSTNGESENDEPDYDEMDPDDIDPDDRVQHPCPTLVTLAVVLMEIYFVTPFEMLAKKYGVEIENAASIRKAHLDVDMVFQACRNEIPENFQFHYVVKKCLDPATWEDKDGNGFNDQTLRIMIYQEVVQPLENELIQAYSSISIEDLDQFAQTLDFGNWDQAILNQQVYGDNSRRKLGQSSEPARPFHFHHVDSKINPNIVPSTCQLDTNSHLPHPFPVYPVKGGNTDYKEPSFFDDEAVSEAHSREARDGYTQWRSDYRAVYKKFITSPASQTPVKIAILDTGIDLSHPDVEARNETIKGKFNWLNEKFRNGIHDRIGHGTFSAGILLDYAPDAHLYVAKIAEGRPSSPRIIAQAINYAVETWKVDIISMSFGFPTREMDGYDELEQAILNAYSKHVLLFAAASNSGGQRGRAYPAREQCVICIHSTDINGNRFRFSPTAVADGINLATVGEAVESAWPVHLCDDVVDPLCIKHKSGTSYATPIAAGIAAFLLQYARQHLPKKADMLKRRKRMETVLRRIAEKGPTYKPRDGYYFIDISPNADGLFGKDESYINHIIGDLLST